MLHIPQEIDKAVDACFAANICFDLSVVIDGIPFRIVSQTEDTAHLINQSGMRVGVFVKE